MGNNKYTELDKLFQSKLNDGIIENGSWKNPTDDAFLSALNNIEPKEKVEKKRVIWWPYLFLLFIPVVVLGIWNTGQVNDLKSEMNDISAQVSKSNVVSGVIEKNTKTTFDIDEGSSLIRNEESLTLENN